VEDDTVTGGESLGDLTLRDEPLDSSELSGRAHLQDFLALDLPELDRSVLEAALRGELAVAQYGPDGLEVFTGLQIPGVLDDLFAEGATTQELGVSWEDGAPTLSLWAPTAKKVTLQLHGPAVEAAGTSSAPTEVAMERGTGGVWTAAGTADRTDQDYTYAVEVFIPQLGEVTTNTVTDPYSVGLTLNSQHSVVLDLEDPRWAPDICTDTLAPVVDQFADQKIYEMHLRDFSAGDEALPAEVRVCGLGKETERNSSSPSVLIKRNINCPVSSLKLTKRGVLTDFLVVFS